MLFLLLVFIGILEPEVAAVAGSLLLIITITVRLCRKDKIVLTYTHRPLAISFIIFLFVGMLVEALNASLVSGFALICLGGYLLYTIFCIVEDLREVSFLRLVFEYLWLDIKGFFWFCYIMLSLVVTAFLIIVLPICLFAGLYETVVDEDSGLAHYAIIKVLADFFD